MMTDFPIFNNERDIEIPILIQWLERNDCQMGSVLDVGCAFSQYASEAKPRAGEYHGLDLIEDKTVTQYLDRFIHGNILFADVPMYDWIFSISTIEHIGVEYEATPLYREFQIEAVHKIARLAKRGFLLTFPYGEDDLFKGRYYNQNKKLLEEYMEGMKGYKIHNAFISTDNPQDPAGWREIPQSLADKATNNFDGRVYTIAVMEAYR